ncbi:HAD family hydrolase [Kamptonema cortianum]|uniref:D,D-heptose 1,7-bisphosphate phosphatase n=1 Tax=Geitlerinema calcuttense NRMC-F 0142 TaxID=2922238 RepID=A0ABT7LX78_9CYAN|nr:MULTISPECIES: HAD family hydrolase [Cyanophyceae]MDK3156653.1 HAD family hydrolase [Kamptonema cortianum]MDL5050338.1 HAD family hydrolase [Oscillatoria amoena NRMC-F 0135]MDL5053391.1 HAD family hydrolase [Oscillatoria laete-virens NRMC-F 0139]MDL5056607.1 HAD family hydrolase [Geitlerinema calcuttense NRMC-F 0142]
MANHAVFLDRDGTLIVDKEYLSNPAGVELLPGVAKGLLDLQEAGYMLFIVSNQSGIGRGLFTEEQMHAVNDRMLSLLPGVKFTHMYFCPDHPDDPKSNSRKPSPKFLFLAEQNYHVNLRKSWFVGDKDIDVLCGINGGCRSILLDGKYSADSHKSLKGQKYQAAKTFSEAVSLILKG